MPVRDRSIGNKGLEQGGPNMGNDYSRNLSRKAKGVDTSDIIVKNKKKTGTRSQQTTAAKKTAAARQGRAK
ncbi:hypothetical protein [uncultured Chitinophaga sp.]|jgi:hypothetical protein|uniref:hypothetical protein n=1 Tax=uncultured Chitinophaga sp. TaxID=339340 RepID=UPI002637A126|nr:hypothetical protein [uncultured Chitinophaga sp.]